MARHGWLLALLFWKTKNCVISFHTRYLHFWHTHAYGVFFSLFFVFASLSTPNCLLFHLRHKFRVTLSQPAEMLKLLVVDSFFGQHTPPPPLVCHHILLLTMMTGPPLFVHMHATPNLLFIFYYYYYQVYSAWVWHSHMFLSRIGL